MKKILLSSMLIVSCLAFGQKIKLKDDKVYVDDKECLSYKSKVSVRNSFFTLDGKPVFYIDVIIVDSKLGVDGSYEKVSFADSEEISTTRNEYSRKAIILQLIEMGVIENCKFNPDRIKDYVKRYNQNFEKSIVRHSY
ncbi:hypothetical protein [Chryseobacterium sp. Leaf394]|uniref:hypothetical protein n=1 Tax=Chryseobacterium sp. Leaf394 TaxID=1736361 RepID=UPI0007008203|nr:hypothetical protein [Chryseobacterium sp. Leaf394]KQS92709.1 hypothetical protein ASG21_09810 [Chryseobacterium sp. Leaf394]